MKRFTKTFSTLSINLIEFINRLTGVNRKLYKSYNCIRNYDVDYIIALLQKHTKSGEYNEETLLALTILISFLKQRYFSQIKLDLYYSEGIIVNRKLGQFFKLKNKSKKQIKNIIQYEFDQTSIQLKEIDYFITILVNAIISNNKDALCQKADISLYFKADILNYINSLNISYKSQFDKKLFFIGILSVCELEVSESSFCAIKDHKLQKDILSFFWYDSNHPFIQFDTYNQYVKNRYSLINNLITNK